MILCPRRLVWSRTLAFHASNMGSNPVGDAPIKDIIMLSISKLFEELASYPLSRALQKRASNILQRSDPKYHGLGLKIAQKAKDVSPKHQRMKRMLT